MDLSLEACAAKVAAAKAVFVDWDGCLVRSGRLLPGAGDFLRLVGAAVFVLSNNSTELPSDFRGWLAAEGLHLPADHIVLAGHETIGRAVRTQGRGPANLIANDRLAGHARAMGLRMVEAGGGGPAAETVVLLRDPEFSYAKLESAANRLRAGARLIVANPDLTHPAEGGAVAPETGALLAALGACVDLDAVEMEVVGKPSAHLFEVALARAGVAADAAVMIGDNPLTDVAGAERLGMASILLSPGGVSLAGLARALAALPDFARHRPHRPSRDTAPRHGD
jgi:HAD superfamily hydrolase (TIGR01450 family)